ncbi:hypothetical protein [Vibrio hyugaensis]|uniref:hypothetical protein n=1 Tax=Vibrio hyugaensis TaxID=1534743 RepID=UPI000CE51B50|nr:hypothetical protein [Vibrio hyugaensis]
MDKKLISEAIDALELLDVYLYSTSVSRFQDITSESFPEEMKQQNKLSISAEFLEPENDQDGQRVINAKVVLGYRYILEEEEEQVLSELEACFIAKYHQSKHICEEAIEEFMKYNVIHNVWPFWREHAFRLSTEANLPKPIISLFKQQPTPK